MYRSSLAERLTIDSNRLELIAAHARRESPREVCGVLGGVGGHVKIVVPVANAAMNPSVAFVMDGAGLLGAFKQLARHGLDLLAFYHSHPPGSRWDPSPSDIAQAAYPDVLTVIVMLDDSGRVASLRAFSIRGGLSAEVPLTAVPFDA
jgi:proteasome lid subunit RPN8/RPN11